MKILHLYSDWKWTGPAEPVIQMCKSLEEQGHDVLFACRATPPENLKEPETVELKAKEYGIKYTTQFYLNRYCPIKETISDIWKLAQFIKKEGFDVVHSHLSHDQSLCTIVRRLVGTRKKMVWIKQMHHREILKPSFLNKLLMYSARSKGNAIGVFTEGFKKKYAERFNLPEESLVVTPMSLDLQKFYPERSFVDQRKAYGIDETACLIGIVARFQHYRRMDIFMKAAKLLVDQEPNVRFMVIGRSSQMEETVIKPMRELGIEDKVVLPGYLIDNYIDMMQTLDIFTLMIPGFDATARALREAMALGKPCVVSNIGMLPDIVEHGKAGLNFDFHNAEELAACWLELVRDAEKRKQMGAYGAKLAKEHYAMENLGTSLTEIYQSLLNQK